MTNSYLKSTVKYKRYSAVLFLDKQTTKVKFLFSGQNATVFGKFFGKKNNDTDFVENYFTG